MNELIVQLKRLSLKLLKLKQFIQLKSKFFHILHLHIYIVYSYIQVLNIFVWINFFIFCVFFCFSFSHAYSYHQKYYLQNHKDLAKTLGLDEKLLRTSHVAARLNGYLVGVGGVKQFLEESSSLGLNEAQKEYVRHYVEENEGGNLYC